jgi:cell division septal protein FtsQ
MKRVRDFHSQSWENPFFDHSSHDSRMRIFCLVGLFAIVVGIVYVFVYSPFFRISRVAVSGASTIDPVRIEAVVSQTLGGYDYYIVPKDNYFYVNTIGINNYLMTKFPNLVSVVAKKKFERLDVAVVERQPTYRLMIGDKSYLLDQEGNGLREAAAHEGEALVALSNDSAEFVAGKPMVQSEWLKAISDLHKYFATQVGIRDQLYKLDAINSDIEVVTVEGWSVIFDPQSDIKDQLKTLTSALAGKFNPDDRKKLLYIDARFGDKIFYKTN